MPAPSAKGLRCSSAVDYAALALRATSGSIKKLLQSSARSRRITDWGILFIDLFDIVMELIRMEKFGEIIIW